MSIFKKHPELLKRPEYDHKRYPSAFEDSLLMVLEQNHLYAERINIKDPYEIDFAIRQTDNGDLQFYAEAEYDASGKLFHENGTIAYDYINIPKRKFKYFEKEKPTVYVKGSKNLKWVLVLDGKYILKFGEITSLPCKFKGSLVRFNDDLIRVNTVHAKERLALFSGQLDEWLKLAKKLHSFKCYREDFL